MRALDVSGKFNQPDWWDWYFAEDGRIGGPWICPDAPIVIDRRGYPISDDAHGQFGTVRAAWIFTNWLSTWYPIEGNRIPAAPGEIRSSSYSLNEWIVLGGVFRDPNTGTSLPGDFLNDGQIQRATITPLLADGVDFITWTDEYTFPPLNLYAGLDSSSQGSPYWYPVAIPRHGGRPEPVPTNWPRTRPLPGAINVGFYDGHCELVKLEQLWQMYWHKDYTPPAKRPGLP
jgi:prepilin-type processing-associated H-X9-DG protein